MTDFEEDIKAEMPKGKAEKLWKNEDLKMKKNERFRLHDDGIYDVEKGQTIKCLNDVVWMLNNYDKHVDYLLQKEKILQDKGILGVGCYHE